MIKALILSVLICGLASAVPTQEEVHLAIPGYTEHKWYSGNYFIMQAISTLHLVKIMEPSIMFSLTHSMTLIMTLLFFG